MPYSNLASTNPSTRELIWTGVKSTKEEVQTQITAGKAFFEFWRRYSYDERKAILIKYADVLKANLDELSLLISNEVGKPLWEARTEVNAMAGKINISIDAYEKRCAQFTSGPSITRFKPHGLVLVLGPFNFPGHLANGHICPALLAGNTVLFKPSEEAPAVGEKMVQYWQEAGLPKSALQIFHGGADIASWAIQQEDVSGVFFTGSSQAGISISKSLADQPWKILALEMGGNNPLIVEEVADLDAASFLIIQSAYLTAGQRCTCSRRLIITKELAKKLIPVLKQWITRIRVGHPNDRPEPFIGSLINRNAAEKVLAYQDKLIQLGAKSIVAAKSYERDSAILHPGLIDCSNLKEIPDEECFGPLLQIFTVSSFHKAIDLANQTKFGLSAGLISDNKDKYPIFYDQIRAGIVNFNQQLTGASSGAPFGGIGHSGNHRPSAYFAADYCAYPVASIEFDSISLPEDLPIGIKKAASNP